MSQGGVSVKQIVQTLKEVSSASAHLVLLAMEGVTEMDAQVGNKSQLWRGQSERLSTVPYQAFSIC